MPVTSTTANERELQLYHPPRIQKELEHSKLL